MPNIEITPQTDHKVIGQILKGEDDLFFINIKSINGEMFDSFKVFASGLKAETQEQILEDVKEWAETNDFELNIKEPAQRGTKIKEILALLEKGATKEDIVAMGYHKNTVATQIGNLKKQKQ